MLTMHLMSEIKILPLLIYPILKCMVTAVSHRNWSKKMQRPYWDQEFLENIGFSRSGYDPSVGQNILKEHDLKDAPMFLVWGVR